MYFLGGTLSGGLAAIIKLIIFSPRPHFFTVCEPSVSAILKDCIDPNKPDFWAPSVVCHNNDSSMLRESLRSFPSYHASVAVYW